MPMGMGGGGALGGMGGGMPMGGGFNANGCGGTGPDRSQRSNCRQTPY